MKYFGLVSVPYLSAEESEMMIEKFSEKEIETAILQLNSLSTGGKEGVCGPWANKYKEKTSSELLYVLNSFLETPQLDFFTSIAILIRKIK